MKIPLFRPNMMFETMISRLPSSARILVVDDNPNNLELLKAVLESEGHVIQMETDALAALKVAQQGDFDLALLDVRMPGMNGYELCELLKADPRTRDVPVIFLSALSDVRDKIAAFESGGADYIVKPFKVAEVIARVAKELIQAAARKRLVATNEELRRKNDEILRAQKDSPTTPTAMTGTDTPTIVDEMRVLDGKYELGDLIGHGGFGVVYRARHVVLDRHVAIKLMRNGDAVPQAEQDRFRLEGVSACRVDHPNAVLVLDAGVTPKGVLYLVMELLSGRSLRAELMTKYRLPLGRALWIAERVASVLAAAHTRGVVHRDIKPDNVFLHVGQGGAEVVKVVDFGIAKLMNERSGPPTTARGMTVGTPEYLAPERLLSRGYDGRSDVYSLGCTLFEMLAGRAPFAPSKDAPWLLAAAHVWNPAPPLVALEPRVPTDLASLVHAALQKEPDDRPTAAEFSARLRELLQSYGDTGDLYASETGEWREDVATDETTLLHVTVPPGDSGNVDG